MTASPPPDPATLGAFDTVPEVIIDDTANLPTARDLPRLRADQLAWHRDGGASDLVTATLGPGLLDVTWIENVFDHHWRGRLFGVTRDATQYAMRRAAGTWTDRPISTSDLPVIGGEPVTSGVVLWGDYIGTANAAQALRVGASGSIEVRVGIGVTTWAIDADRVTIGFWAWSGPGLTELPPMTVAASVHWNLGTSGPGLRSASDGDPVWARRVGYLVALWGAYNRSPLIEERIVRPGAKGRSASALKRAAGSTRTPHDPVRVVRFAAHKRTYRATDQTDAAGRVYTCRWLVPAHVRHYHVKDPSTGALVREPRDIEEYIAGPSDKPLRLRETVRLIDR